VRQIEGGSGSLNAMPINGTHLHVRPMSTNAEPFFNIREEVSCHEPWLRFRFSSGAGSTFRMSGGSAFLDMTVGEEYCSDVLV
jgi:hypothetical protein